VPKYPERSLQAQCGIITCYPGLTEYLDRYRNEEDDHITHYKINPLPDYNIDGRRVARVKCSNDVTEYQYSFVYPDAKKLVKYPWLRK